MALTAEIREKLYCSDCKNCKLMVWQNDDEEDDKLDDLSRKRGYIIKDRALKAFYMVRCGWTKDTVFQPHQLVKCEGKQLIGGNDG
jgi:hypothetical protein